MAFIPEESVAIILVNWNGYDFTRACLESLSKVDFPDFRVILVDNASQNQEGSRLKKSFPEIELIENSQNLGFAGGNNVGIRYALEQGFSNVMLLNNDTKVEPDFLGQMIRKFNQEPRFGVVQPLILFMHDPKKIWSAGGKWISALGRAITLGDQSPISDYRFKKPELDWATGCCMLISREALLKTGLLNEQYFTYFEDVEWSLRFRKAGFRIALAEKAIVYHEAGASSKKKNAEGTLSPRVFYYHVRNQFLLIRSQKAPIGLMYHLLRFTLWMGYFLIRVRFQKLKSVAKGIVDGLTQPLQSPPQWP
ncbi:glycosyltransferase family 2 protein [Algoriphagus lacus]|uniref:Glycosyltransferase family 2 protein n=1 Tax=Algoriphagus lacus TaxID=2056311 RepID=A0A418PW83_9BACT|nr:glycosyltransferase family 2 protein [Algoriphagus lacus]RIW18316.1 glycosyltransferase family 2 protein [Algoriphagus lacus]